MILSLTAVKLREWEGRPGFCEGLVCVANSRSHTFPFLVLEPLGSASVWAAGLLLWKQQGLEKALASFPGGPSPPFLAGPLPSTLTCPRPACSLSSPRLLHFIASCSLTALNPTVPDGPSSSLSGWPPSALPFSPASLFLSLPDPSSLFSGPPHWSPKVGRAGFPTVLTLPMPPPASLPRASGWGLASCSERCARRWGSSWGLGIRRQ